MLNIIENPDFTNTFKIGDNSFSRTRKFTFQSCFLFICSIPNKRLQSELDCFFNQFKGIANSLRTVTSSAFSQYRDKISYQAFKTACFHLADYFYTNYSFAQYHQMRLVAIDGTVLTLPRNEHTIKEFGDNILSSGKTWIKAQVSFASDVLNGICLDACIGAYKTYEVRQVIDHLKKLGQHNLYLFDRGYFGRDSSTKYKIQVVNFVFGYNKTPVVK
ncbi:hypothetical protein ABW636_10755 [Aquimarina sp. 2201CG1-2-11]|uniref:hypothetical protein n=1 Tax=Aquimarina discodermiae TaxID=3231043 RepID=UPI0034636033